MSRKQPSLKSFRDFMKERVEEYYSSPVEKFSSKGDFFTSPELDRAFGYAVASFIAPLIEPLKTPVILELGAGRGLMARDILSYLREYHTELFGKLEYRIYELSPSLVQVQRDILQDFEKVSWVQELQAFEGVVVSNEFFDALPVHVVREGSQLFISGDRDEVWLSLEDPEITEFLREMGYLDMRGVVEVPLDAIYMLRRIAQNLLRGYNLVIDYGYTSEEIVKFPEGTVMGYKKHRAFSDVVSEELMDITAHVNFSALITYGAKFGLEPVLFDTQRNFLASNPYFMSELEKLAFDESPEGVERLSRLKTMLISMGDRFRVLLQKKGI